MSNGGSEQDLHPHRRCRRDRARQRQVRVPKHALRVAAYGTSDELNSALGVARLHAEGEIDAALMRIQNDLFDLGRRSLPARHGEGRRGRVSAAADDRRPGGPPGGRDRRDERQPRAAAQLHPAGRHAAGGASACLPHRRPPGRAADGGTGRRRGGQPGSGAAISTGSATGSSSPRAAPTTAARTTSSGCRGRTADAAGRNVNRPSPAKRDVGAR